MKKLILVFLMVVFIPPSAFADEKEDIRAVLENQTAAWNRGDIPGFMEGYWKSNALRFASGGNITYGWKATLEGYQAGYKGPEAMGVLRFSKLEIKVLSQDHALVFGRWDLERDLMDIGGLFTLLFEKRPEGWRIIADHTSSDDLPIMALDE
ncbi:MAG: nuclear transport factor 2 family protein [Sphingomonadales bacterium]